METLDKIKSRLDNIPIIYFIPILILLYGSLFYVFRYMDDQTLVAMGGSIFTTQLFLYIAVGVGAQLIDGALGMAYGVSSSTFLMTIGVSPASASAAVHVAEVFTTGASGVSHFTFNNVNRRLFKALVIPGVLGAATGAYILSTIDGDSVKPFVSLYLLLMGINIIFKATKKHIQKQKIGNINVLALAGGFLDSIGGGGWGPVVTSTLLSKGRNPQYTIGSVNASEFFIAFTSAGVFTWVLGLHNVDVIVGLIIGGVFAAPFGALLVGKLKPRTLMLMVGILITFLSVRNMIKYIPELIGVISR